MHNKRVRPTLDQWMWTTLIAIGLALLLFAMELGGWLRIADATAALVGGQR